MAFDKNVLLRDGSTALNADELTPAGVDFGGPDLVPVTYQVHVPSVGGTSPTLDITIQESDDNSTWRTYLTMPQITAAGEYFITGKSDARYRRATRDVGGTSPNFGNVVIGPVPGGRYNKF